jgi:hypothetical protein
MRLAADQAPRCMAQDAEHLYWMNEDGRLAGVDKRGGPVVVRTLAAAPLTVLPDVGGIPPSGCGIVIDGGFAYATVYGLGKIARISLTSASGAWEMGTEVKLLGSFLTPSSLAVDEHSLYVAEQTSGAIKKVGKDLPDGGAADDGSSVTELGRAAPRAYGLVGDADALYWFDEQALRKMAKRGGAIVTLVSQAGGQLTLSPGRLHWLGGSYVVSMPVSGEEAPSTVDWRGEDILARQAEEQCLNYPSKKIGAGPQSIGSDGVDLVWGALTTFYKAPAAGGAPAVTMFDYREKCSPPETWAKHMIVDATRVFWADDTQIWVHPR